MAFSYANATLGSRADTIGWYDFNDLRLEPNACATYLGGTLQDGTQISFDISLTPISGASMTFQATSMPLGVDAQIDTTKYKEMLGDTLLTNAPVDAFASSFITINNIVVKDAGNHPISHYTLLLRDAQQATADGKWIWRSDGTVWKSLTQIGEQSTNLHGLGTQQVTLMGTRDNASDVHVLYTNSPTQVQLTLDCPYHQQFAFALGFATMLDDQIKNDDSNITDIPAIRSTIHGQTKQTSHVDVQEGRAKRAMINPQINKAMLVINKTTNKTISFINDTILYSITIKNTGDVSARQVVISDALATGLAYVEGSLISNVALTGTPTSSMELRDPIKPGASVSLSFQVNVNQMPLPNPIVNKANVAYVYTDPVSTSNITVNAVSESADTIVFRNNYQQQVNDLIESVALQEAALAAIANAEGSKIQKIVSMSDVTTQQLLCLNKSVTDMLESISLLEAILKQKISVVDCQIHGSTC